MGLEIIVAKNSGFCFGVERSIRLALSASDSVYKKGKKRKISVYTLGPLIHNPQVVEELQKKGVKVISKLAEAKNGILIICSHGVSPEVLKEPKHKNFKIIDATCPFVKRAQKLVSELMKQNYQVVIIGDSYHPEVRGLLGFTSGQGIAVANIKDINKIPSNLKCIGVVAQTTQLLENFKKVICKLVDKTEELKIYNTICEATLQRQKSAKNLARKVDLMLVIGGYNSANTTRLAEVCKKYNPSTYHIEKSEDFDISLLKGKKKIGITAGASTPNWVVKEIVDNLSIITKKF